MSASRWSSGNARARISQVPKARYGGRGIPRLFPTGTIMTATKPKVLFVYDTYSQQTLRVVEVMTSVRRERGSSSSR